MRKFASVLAILGLLAAPASAEIVGGGIFGEALNTGTMMVTPLLTQASTTTGPSNSATQYASFIGNSASSAFSATIAARQAPISAAGTIDGLSVYFPTTFVQGSWAISLNVGGSSQTLTCTVQSGSQSCTDSGSHPITVAAGNLVVWQATPTGTPTAQTESVLISATFTSTVGQQSLIFGGAFAANMSNSAQNFSGFSGGPSGWNATEVNVSSVMPTAGTFDNLYAAISGTPGGAANYAFTVYKNGSATALTCTVTSAAVACNDQTGAHAVTVVQGDTISISETPTSTPTARVGMVSMRWAPTTANQALLLGVPQTMPGTTVANRFLNLNGSANNDTVEAHELNIAPVLATHMTISNLTIAQCPGPGAAVTRTITLRAGTAGGALSSKNPTATVAAGTTACPTFTTATDTASYQPASAEVLDFLTTVSGTNTALTTLKTGMTVTVP